MFGRTMRQRFELAADGTFLNHGSFGAPPRCVLEAQREIRARMESQPDRFFRDEVMPEAPDTALRRAAAHLGRFVNAPGGAIAFVENATAGVQAVLRSFDLRPGDRVLFTEHTYNAVRLMAEARCAETGASAIVVALPIPASEQDIVARVRASLVPGVKLAIIDHITSPSALVLALERLVPLLREAGARVLVDGAHGVGQLPLDLARLGADWYTSNAHKWLFAPRGTAFLYASNEVAAMTRPHIISHYVELGFPRSFDYIGTRDYSAWLAVPAAISFLEELGPDDVRAYGHGLLEPATRILATLGAEPVAPLSMCASMRSFVLPQRRAAQPDDGAALMSELWEKERVQAHASVLGGRLLTRVSGQVYVDEEDLQRLAQALERRGWPGR